MQFANASRLARSLSFSLIGFSLVFTCSSALGQDIGQQVGPQGREQQPKVPTIVNLDSAFGPGLTEAEAKDPNPIRTKLTYNLRSVQKMVRSMLQQHAAPEAIAAKTVRNTVHIRPDGSVETCVWFTDLTDTELAAVQAEGIVVDVSEPVFMKAIQAYLTPDQMDQLAAWPNVLRLAVVDYGVVRTGTVNSQGDAKHRANQVRTVPKGVSGAGTNVGVISDGVVSRNAAAASQNLPETAAGSGIANILLHAAQPGTAAGNGDEGTAMLEIVYDVAPGSPLQFSRGFGGAANMVNSINWMTLAPQAHIIVDDIGYYSEPYFADGPIAAAALAANNAGSTYVSAAGNDANARHNQSAYTNMVVADPPSSANGWNAQNWGGGDYSIDFTLNNGTAANPASFSVHLQWNDQFGASANDYDLYITSANAAHTPQLSSTGLQNGTQNPYENVSGSLPNGSGAVNFRIIVRRFNAAGPNTLELFLLGNAQMNQFSSAADSIFGHPAVPQVVSTAAVNHAPAGNCAVENFSSVGPSTIRFPAATVRATPFVAGADNVSVTGVGGFGSPFPGTSAAAPHVGAVAALIRSCNPAQTPAQIRTRLMTLTQCTPGGPNPPPYGPGNNASIGFGFVDARNAVNSACPGVFCPDFAAPLGTVNVADLLVVINKWGPCPGGNPCPAFGDMDFNGVVNVIDLLYVITRWGPCPVP